jgi:hypothetical protein
LRQNNEEECLNCSCFATESLTRKDFPSNLVGHCYHSGSSLDMALSNNIDSDAESEVGQFATMSQHDDITEWLLGLKTLLACVFLPSSWVR